MDRRRLENLPDILELPDLAAFLNCGYRAALQLVHRRDFPSLKVGRKWKVNKKGLAHWLERQTAGKRSL
mgnify:CR=1 FL=1